MSKFGKPFMILLALLLCLVGAASAETARDLTADCAFDTRGKPARPYTRLYDHDYKEAWAAPRNINVYLEVVLPEGETCSGVQIKWARVEPAWQIQLWDGAEWTPCYTDETGYLTTYTELPEVTKFRITAHEKNGAFMEINELNVLSAGERPDWVQVWEPTYEKADLMLLVAHPDDEYVFMGGLIPYYGTEKGKQVVVAYITNPVPARRSELLDGLWTVGQRHYPVIGTFSDRYTLFLSDVYKHLEGKKPQKYMTELVRKYKPDVLVTHDVKGEYGHGMHQLCADLTLKVLDISGDATQYTALAEQYGVWEIPKTYIHLYPEAPVVLDWSQPLAAFNGQTAFDVARAGFACHLSQQGTEYEVYEDGPYDSRQFGLVRSLVGEDVNGNDFFENLD